MHRKERPPTRRPNRTGMEWLEKFMTAQGAVMANSLFLTFGIGQAGAVLAVDIDTAEKMVAVLREDVDDLEQAANELVRVTRDIVANAERNVAARKAER